MPDTRLDVFVGGVASAEWVRPGADPAYFPNPHPARDVLHCALFSQVFIGGTDCERRRRWRWRTHVAKIIVASSARYLSHVFQSSPFSSCKNICTFISAAYLRLRHIGKNTVA